MQIVAEIGSTHRGDLKTALFLIDEAKAAQANAVKFIMTDADALIADKSIQYENEGNLYEIIKGFQFADSQWKAIFEYCKNIGIECFVSIGTPNYIELAESLGCPRYKIGAWDIRNKYLIDAIAETRKPVLVDISNAIYGEVCSLISWLRMPASGITLVYESHGELNLNSIPFLKDTFTGCRIGYSSNDRGIVPDIIAVTIGVDYIEKRIALNDSGHHADMSLSAKEFKEWVKNIREAKTHLGKYGLYPSMTDIAGKQKYFTSLVFSQDVKAGETITQDMCCAMRPGHGIAPIYDYLFIGKPAKRDIKQYELATYEMVDEWK